MTGARCPYAFRIVGSCRNPRLLIDAGVAFAAHAACDERAEPDREAYLSAFRFGEDFRQQLESTGSTKGFTGVCWSPWVWWDIDREDDLEAATTDARRLVVAVTERYSVVEEDVLVFYSGSKGFHIGLPTAVWQPEPSESFNRIARRLAERVAELADVTVDAGIYDKLRAFRAPNSKHPKTGRHKRRLSVDELLHLSTAAILAKATEPEPFDVPNPTCRCERAADDWAEAAEQVRQHAEAVKQRRVNGNGSATLNQLTLDFIRDGAGTGDRHRLLFSAAGNLGEFDCPPALAHALLTDAALDCGLPPKDVRRQIDCGLETAKGGDGDG